MDSLWVILMILIWLFSPGSRQEEETEVQLSPRLEVDGDGNVVVTLFPSRTHCISCTSVPRLWSAFLLREADGMLERVDVVEGPAPFTRSLADATTRVDHNVTVLRIASDVPMVMGFLEGYLLGDLISAQVREAKSRVAILYGVDGLAKVLSYLSSQYDIIVSDVEEYEGESNQKETEGGLTCVLDMLEGIFQGAQRVLSPTQKFSKSEYLLLNVVDELPTILRAVGIEENSTRFERETDEKEERILQQMFMKYFGSSLSVKITSNKMHFGQVSWNPNIPSSYVKVEYILHTSILRCGAQWSKKGSTPFYQTINEKNKPEVPENQKRINNEEEEREGWVPSDSVEDFEAKYDNLSHGRKRDFSRFGTHVLSFLALPGVVSPLFSLAYRIDKNMIIGQAPAHVTSSSASLSTSFSTPQRQVHYFSFLSRFQANIFANNADDWKILFHSSSYREEGKLEENYFPKESGGLVDKYEEVTEQKAKRKKNPDLSFEGIIYFISQLESTVFEHKLLSIELIEATQQNTILKSMDITQDVLDKGYWISKPLIGSISIGECGNSKCREKTFADQVEEVSSLYGLLKATKDSIESEVAVPVLTTLMRYKHKKRINLSMNGMSISYSSVEAMQQTR